MQDKHPEEARQAARAITAGTFIVTSSHEGRRSGAVARSVMVAAEEPLLLAVSVRCGHWIEPVIRDSRKFGVCRIDDPESVANSLLLRKCAEPARPREGDVLDAVPTTTLSLGVPLLAKSGLIFECEVLRHFDLEADHEMYIGRVIAARLSDHAAMIESKPGEVAEKSSPRRRRG